MKALSGVALLFAFLSPSAFAQWDLSAESSKLNFVSIKSLKVGEVHSFEKLTGKINDSGQVELNIDLSSVETNIGIRNERIEKMLFDTAKFVDAKLTGFVDVEKLASLNVGDTYSESVKFNLSLHGVINQITTDVQVTKLNDQRLLVTSVMPLVINASDYGLEKGVQQLKEIAGLPSISTAVPVTFNLIFKQ
ncbi:YceI family protein [uncultured Psychromonas sp.]|uniref:YceI family protein n=1 Tax=uncultured Psychromonas sp. TaxID=173974 RepID=UPI00261B31F3|nr:YceI family protein [uncultured Psychromonas sp.]